MDLSLGSITCPLDLFLGEIILASLHFLDVVGDQVNCGKLKEVGAAVGLEESGEGLEQQGKGIGGAELSGGVKCPPESTQCCCCHL